MGVEDYDVELYQDIEELVDQGELEEGTAAFGISQQVIHLGYDSLSVKQKNVFNQILVPALKQLRIEREMQHKIARAPK